MDDETNEIKTLFIGKENNGNDKDAPQFEIGRETYCSCGARHNIMAPATGGNCGAQVEIVGDVEVEEKLNWDTSWLDPWRQPQWEPQV